MGGRDVVADLKNIERIQGTDIPGALVITSALQLYYTPTDALLCSRVWSKLNNQGKYQLQKKKRRNHKIELACSRAAVQT